MLDTINNFAHLYKYTAIYTQTPGTNRTYKAIVLKTTIRISTISHLIGSHLIRCNGCARYKNAQPSRPRIYMNLQVTRRLILIGNRKRLLQVQTIVKTIYSEKGRLIYGQTEIRERRRIRLRWRLWKCLEQQDHRRSLK